MTTPFPRAVAVLPTVCVHSEDGDPASCSLCHGAVARIVTRSGRQLLVDGVALTTREFVYVNKPPRNVRTQKKKPAVNAAADEDDDV